MKIKFLHGSDSKRLILIFAGWAMDSRPFDNLTYPGYRLAVVWDYTDELLETEELNDFDEICVLAWSYGVFMAARFMASHPELPITASVAVNGTMHPVNKRYGIAPEIFDMTLKALSAQSVMKFYRRMCGGSSAYARFGERMPQRDTDSLAAELKNISDTYRRDGAPEWSWDYAFISDNDLVILPESQVNAWTDAGTAIRRLDGAHLPDFNRLLNEAFIRKEGVVASFTRSAATYDDNATAQRKIAERLAAMVTDNAPLAGDVLEIGCGSGMFTKELVKYAGQDTFLTLMDVSPIAETLPGKHIVCDAETEIRKLADNSVDAVVSASAVQWFNSPRRFLSEARRVLRPGGIIGLAVYGDKTFHELPGYKSPSRIFSIGELKDSIPAELEIVKIEDALITSKFDSSIELLRHFRLTGVAPSGTSPESMATARAVIASGITTLTYNPIFLLLTGKYL